jgi:hypothetical protein
MNHAHNPANRTKGNYLQTFLLTLILCLGLTGCGGGPKYQKKFSDWFKMTTAEKIPVKINDVEVEETATNGDAAIFQFTATGETTEDLYTQENVANPAVMNDLTAAFQKAAQEGVSNEALITAGGEQALETIKATVENAPLILKVVTPKGSDVGFKGKGRATLGKTDWEFQTVELTQDPLPGTPKPNGKLYVLSGSPEHKKLIAAHEAAVTNIRETLNLAKKIDAEEDRVAAAESAKNEAETKARLEKEAADTAAAEKLAEEQFLAKQAAVLKRLVQGTYYLANWQGADSRGTLGMTIGEGTNIGTSHSMDAFLSNSPENTHSKKVTLALTGKGTKEEPFILQVSALATGYTDHGNFHNFTDSSRGFVTEDTTFKLALTINQETGSLSGILSDEHRYGPNGPVNFEFKLQDSKTPAAQKPTEAKPAETKPAAGPEITPETNGTEEGANNPKEKEPAMDEEAIKAKRKPIVDASRPDFEKFADATKAGDMVTAKKLMLALREEHPESPHTFQARLMICLSEVDVEGLDTNIGEIQKSEIITEREKEIFQQDYLRMRKIMVAEQKNRAAKDKKSSR